LTCMLHSPASKILPTRKSCILYQFFPTLPFLSPLTQTHSASSHNSSSTIKLWRLLYGYILRKGLSKYGLRINNSLPFPLQP
jgi:hypothetical protein